MLSRILPNGNLDTTFGINGIVISDIYSGAELSDESVVQSDGKIVTVGSASEPFPYLQNYLALVRYLPNGALDSSFNNDGIVIENISFTAGQTGTDINICPDGGILASGRVWDTDTTGFFNIFLAKYLSGLTTGIQDLTDVKSPVVIYPNPNNGTFTISQNSTTTTEIEINNILGELVYNTNTAMPQTTIDLSREVKGIYFVRITDNNRNVSNKKIIIQ